MSSLREQAMADLVVANHILSHEGVLDAFGHVSVRDPDNSQQFLLSRSLSPQFVEREDIMVLNLAGEPVENAHHRPYAERILHAKIYEARPDVQAICHHHALSVIPFSTTGVEIRPICHVGGLFYEGVPVYDDYDVSDGMLIVNPREGERIARTLGHRRAMLLRGHGAVVVGRNLPECVMGSIYLALNAEIQQRAEALGEPKYLSYEEARAAAQVMLSELPQERAWNYWRRRAGHAAASV
ncbi:MAG: class II aldolase/adducin family protein [Alicyclobacillus sp.]|nr:class II aldolase/adducin family protein [Alicyclobacillus sp.]